MRVLVGAIAVLLAAGSLGTVSESQRYVPFTLVAGGAQTIDMNERHPSHGELYVLAGLNRISGLVNPEDWRAISQVNFRKSIVVAAVYDLTPDICPRSLTIQRLRVHRGRLGAKAVVGVGSDCVFIPEIQGVHLYSVAALSRSSVTKLPQPRDLWFTFETTP